MNIDYILVYEVHGGQSDELIYVPIKGTRTKALRYAQSLAANHNCDVIIFEAKTVARPRVEMLELESREPTTGGSA